MFTSSATWKGISFDASSPNYTAASDGGPVLRYVTINAIATGFAGITIAGAHPLVSHVTISAATFGISYATTAFSIQLSFLTVVGGDRAVSAPCSLTMCALGEPCYLRDSTFVSQMNEMGICLKGSSLNGGVFILERNSYSAMQSVSFS